MSAPKNTKPMTRVRRQVRVTGRRWSRYPLSLFSLQGGDRGRTEAKENGESLV